MALVLALAGTAAACGRDPIADQPPESYALLAAAGKAASPQPARPLDLSVEPALTLQKLLNEGFAAEALRTVYLAKQLVRYGAVNGARYPADLTAAAALPVLLVVGLDEGGNAKGVQLERRFGGPALHPTAHFLGLSANVEGDKALVQTLTGRLATHAATWVAGGTGDARQARLIDAYRMAMEVIAREWRAGGQAIAPLGGTLAQRQTFAAVRENHGVAGPDGKATRSAAELLSDPIVAATVLHRLAQTRTVANRPAAADLYLPYMIPMFPSGRPPEGIAPAAVLGPVRNFQAKLFAAWGRAVGKGQPPVDIVDLLTAYGALFPEERKEVVRIYLTTTFAATTIADGVSRAPEQTDASIARLGELTDDVLAGRRTLRDALAAPATPPGEAGVRDPGRERSKRR